MTWRGRHHESKLADEFGKKARLWSWAYIKTYAMALMSNVCFYTLVSTFSLYLGDRGFGNESIGLMASGYAVGGMLMRMLCGRWVDTQGRRRMALIGAALFAMPLVFYLLAPATPALTALFRAMQGVGSAALNLSLATMAADVLHPDRFAEGIGYYGLTCPFGQAVGPSIGVSMLSMGYAQGLFSLDLVLCAVTMSLLLTMGYEKGAKASQAEPSQGQDEPPIQQCRLPRWADHRALRWIWKFFAPEALASASVVGLIAFSAASLYTFLSPYMLSLGLKKAGLFFTVQAACMMIARIASGQVAPRLGLVKTLWLGLGMMSLGYGLIGLSHGYGGMFTAAALYGLGAGSCYPVLMVRALERAPKSARGRAISTSYAADDIGVGVGALVCGVLVTHFGYRCIYFVAAGLLVGGIALSTLLFGYRERGTL